MVDEAEKFADEDNNVKKRVMASLSLHSNPVRESNTHEAPSQGKECTGPD
jgi:hypothetical protein